jgi:hypothetical protein
LPESRYSWAFGGGDTNVAVRAVGDAPTLENGDPSCKGVGPGDPPLLVTTSFSA